MQCPLFAGQASRLAGLALSNRLPTVFGTGGGQLAREGGLMNYGASVATSWYRAATYVHRILQGAKPADLPVEQPVRFELVINDKTTKALGLTLPSDLLRQADEVIR